MLIYLAGCEGGDVAEPQKKLIKNAFFSYYYMRKKPIATVLIDGRQYYKNIIIDSGAHTFFSELADQGLSVSVHRKKTKTKDTPDSYFARYVQWLKNHYNYYDYFVELDIGEIVTQQKVLRWREVLKQENLYQKCITVYHPSVMTYDDWLATIQDSQSKYVAVEGDRFTRKRLPYLKLIKPAYDANVRVHGFAMVKRNALDKYPFYSVDSSSWKAGNQYGASLGYSADKGIHAIQFSKNPKDVFNLVGEVKGLVDAVQYSNKNTKRNKQLEIAIKAYAKMEEHYTRVWQKRGIIWQS